MLVSNNSTGLYDPSFEHDACGIGFVANIKGSKSHQHIADALTVLENMEHRGACGCESNTGDGAGIMIQIPHEFFFDECIRQGVHLPAYGKYGVGFIFFPKELRLREECRDIFNRSAEKLGLDILCYRKVPVNTTDIGKTALSVEPFMEQVFIACPDHLTNPVDFERKLFVLRNYATHTINNTVKKDEIGFYLASLSHKTIVYKGQLTSTQVRGYFPDLNDKRVVSTFGLVHSRFATNTFPSWKLAQPFRYIAHNGEINTLQGNLNWLRTSEKGFTSPYFTREEMDMLLPIVTHGQSDSACLDNMIELLTLTGRSLPHVMMMLIPEAWDGNDQMAPVKKAFYEYHACMMEPWDGPASISFTDGKIIGATLDRNGLRPSRYCVTTDDRVIMASETGTLPIDPSLIKEKGRLQPGKMFVVDMEQGRIISDEELKQQICSQKPYGEWLNKYKIRLEELPEPRVMFTHLEHDQVFKYQKAFGYSTEDLDTIIAPMALDGKEPIGSMGTDTPLAVLSEQPQHLSSYFKQLFAQVTNPPIDPIRERMVMSLATFAGSNGNLLVEEPLACHSVALKHPVLNNYELEKIRSIDTGIFQAKTLQTYFRADGKPGSLKAGLDRICRYAADAVEDGFEVLILTDRAIDSDHAQIPSLLATAAVHHHLIRKGYRGQVGIIVEAGDVWEVHHFACLIAFGATAINPYLALSSIRDMKLSNKLQTDIDADQLKKNYIKAVNEGLLKVFSKMGISTLQSYQGAQIFEIIGLNKKVVDTYFTGATSRIEGMGLDEIAKETLAKHFFAFGKKEISVDRLPVGGIYQWKRKGEFHLFNPQTIHLLQHATKSNDYATFKKYSKLINDQSEKACTLRSLFQFRKNRPSISIDEVEPAENIYKRFATGAMSFGSISWEAHTTLAIAMNRLGGKSNTGEGGEDEIRYQPLPNGDSMRSSIKQVASARFGVTSLYLTEADELQIKMAQGAKPGEGGQLPGHKVDEWIGKTRHATPGVGLISPPPHHDIYSIEDLAQLIFDLKNANRKARINVKLVSKAGVGTIAAGVAKAKADVVLISGHDGGTGASPISSIKHAGLPWELGLAETHQTLVKNKLRSRIVVQADGQMKTGRDIAIATLLGAEEWGVATAALIVEGCIMMRKCHLNTCPVGVATQDPELRKRFAGDPDHVVHFFKFITQELREIMAELGYRTVNEMVGQVDDLEMREGITHWKYDKLDLSAILFKEPESLYTGLYQQEEQDHGLSSVLDWKLLALAKPAIDQKEKVRANVEIKNTDRTVGTILSNEITKKYRAAGLPDDTIHFSFQGTAGQSFGAFNTKGITLELEGDANDYFGKGLSGATLIVYPAKASAFVPEENIIIGNVALYGATSGKAFIRGKAGERFAVRNSGAEVVVEGVGDHGCEYMTGGKAIILGSTGRNFAAGMSGGIAYIYDVEGSFAEKCNMEMVALDPLETDDSIYLKEMITQHHTYTNSTVARFILDDFDHQLKNFVKVFPGDYKKALQKKATVTQGY
ncbi:MAG: glutamate synthase large subunit [Sediminibacterium sp. Gen4]|jgi:glutamate synthase (NADPH/NADH) large chain|uniref:glutamate synthase large subunit n=1 Tax=unclassified Sediminibacterium TaxID=2635961 RepID=UPI0015C0603A|nr:MULTISPECIES: glutamate synthase large subunit [unclassified Sediminibacterium]MBW0164708.1 glutamate synthase large subunit [Sediminibacterium sp.]NWK65974.1 glutamate synthase large subunit [Sediminibacterium sp. Gen4]